MTNQLLQDYGRVEDRLLQLRQAIIRVDPTVMVDGRFEEMFVTPLSVIDVARQLIETIPTGASEPLQKLIRWGVATDKKNRSCSQHDLFELCLKEQDCFSKRRGSVPRRHGS